VKEREDPTAEFRRRLQRRATLLVYGPFAAAAVLTLLGAALIAFLLRGMGFPFLRLWLTIIAIVVVPTLVMLVIRAIRRPRDSSGSN
jgi:4-hydroxybenzoate polyprenyltransferase